MSWTHHHTDLAERARVNWPNCLWPPCATTRRCRGGAQPPLANPSRNWPLSWNGPCYSTFENALNSWQLAHTDHTYTRRSVSSHTIVLARGRSPGLDVASHRA
jgi:hypothetical protein